MSSQRWTAFWKALGVMDYRRNRTLSNYNPKSDITALKKVGVKKEAIDFVYKKLSRYDDGLMFKKFSRFFRKDVSTILIWTRSRNITAAFRKLFNILDKKDFVTAKELFLELAVVFEFYIKGEGQIFQGQISGNPDLRKFPVSKLLRTLHRHDPKSKYRVQGIVSFGKETIISIEKRGDKTTKKFIKFSKERSILRVALSMDSKREYNAARNAIGKYFTTLLDTPQSTKSFSKFTAFLKKGKSKHFILTGIGYLDGEFRVTATPAYNRMANVADLDIYKEKMKGSTKKLSVLSQIRIAYLDKSLSKPLFISILKHTEGIFGAVLMRPDDKRLTTVQRRKLYVDFSADFKIPLNEFLTYKDIDVKTIYRHFLKSGDLHATKIELRSNEALKAFQSLVQRGLITAGGVNDEISKTCVNSLCQNYFLPIWSQAKYCPHCGEALIDGRNVEISKIDEKDAAAFLNKNYKDGTINLSSKKLLTRPLLVNQIEWGGRTADFITVVSRLNEVQLMVLKFRYPHAVLVTAKDNVQELRQAGFQSIPLWELVNSLDREKGKLIKSSIDESNSQSLQTRRALFTKALKRIDKESEYKTLNRQSKYLGAEMFEADCSIILDYIFGNCIWLGAKHRGKSLPDGFAAFPVLQAKRGCFIWDGKFSEGATIAMGKFFKNKKYIAEAKANKSIRTNGGLKGFVFISNNTFPQTFSTKYKSLVNGRAIKMSFLRLSQLAVIAKHYRDNESLIMNNLSAREKFIESMVDLLFTTAGKRKCEIVSDAFVTNLVADNVAFLNTLDAGRSLNVD